MVSGPRKGSEGYQLYPSGLKKGIKSIDIDMSVFHIMDCLSKYVTTIQSPIT